MAARWVSLPAFPHHHLLGKVCRTALAISPNTADSKNRGLFSHMLESCSLVLTPPESALLFFPGEVQGTFWIAAHGEGQGQFICSHAPQGWLSCLSPVSRDVGWRASFPYPRHPMAFEGGGGCCSSLTSTGPVHLHSCQQGSARVLLRHGACFSMSCS